MSAPWTDAAWLAEAHAWIAAQLERLGLSASGPIEQPHVRPWSTVLRIPTETGDLWFKAGMPALAHEAQALEILVRRRPDGGTHLRELANRWGRSCRSTPASRPTRRLTWTSCSPPACPTAGRRSSPRSTRPCSRSSRSSSPTS